MSVEVKLTITQGLSEGKEFAFHESTIGMIGRAEDCLLRLPNTLPHLNVSRHHCLLDIDPPEVWVRDLGSRNGTYVNGRMIGQRERGRPPEETAALDLPEYLLGEGDEVRVGDTVFRVSISEGDRLVEDTQQIVEGSEVLVG
jgi:pSer/pThr/pTyr-binding forkhead associated (FHA) protein